MTKKKPRKPKPVPLGKLPKLTDEDLDDLAFISPADIERAKLFGEKNAGKNGRDLLNATRKKPDA